MARGEKIASSKVTILSKEKQPFPVPENWFWTDIDSINQYSGLSIDPMKQPDTTFELYSVPSSADDYPEIITGSEIGSVKQSVIKNDVLLCKINPRINRVWKISQYTDNELMASSEWIIIRNSVINPDYLMFCFRTQYFREFMLSNVSGVGGSLMRAQPKFVKKYPIPIAPITEQQRIVDRIESLFAKLDEAKEKTQAVVDGFELRKSAILHKAFTGELTERWRKEHGVGLDSWNVISFGNLILNGPQNGLYKPKDAYGNGTKILRIDGFYDGYVEDWGTLKRLTLSAAEIELYELHLDEIVINRVNSMPYLGKSALIRELPETCVFESNMMRISLNKERVIPEFIIRYLNSPAGLAELRKNAKQAVNQASINQKDVKNVIVKLPASDEQAEIVRILDSVLTQEQQAKEAAEAVLSQIDTMKKAILARAFRGELGTNDPAEVSEAELVTHCFSGGEAADGA